jgi:hypothetical protein
MNGHHFSLTTFTITYAVYAPAEWADTLTLPYFTSTNIQYVPCVRTYLLQVGPWVRILARRRGTQGRGGGVRDRGLLADRQLCE